MPTLLQVHFPFPGPFGKEAAEKMHALAQSINDEPGFLWKIWTENEQEQEAGGIYLFADEASAKDYIRMHEIRLKSYGVENVIYRIFAVNEALSKVNHGPIQQ